MANVIICENCRRPMSVAKNGVEINTSHNKNKRGGYTNHAAADRFECDACGYTTLVFEYTGSGSPDWETEYGVDVVIVGAGNGGDWGYDRSGAVHTLVQFAARRNNTASVLVRDFVRQIHSVMAAIHQPERLNKDIIRLFEIHKETIESVDNKAFQAASKWILDDATK